MLSLVAEIAVCLNVFDYPTAVDLHWLPLWYRVLSDQYYVGRNLYIYTFWFSPPLGGYPMTDDLISYQREWEKGKFTDRTCHLPRRGR
jgi:hypothetical protein